MKHADFLIAVLFWAMNMKNVQNEFPPTSIIFLIVLVLLPGTSPVDLIQESKQSFNQQCQYNRNNKSPSQFKQENTCLLRRDEIAQQQPTAVFFLENPVLDALVKEIFLFDLDPKNKAV